MPKKGKFRVVFAASARYKDDCLNDQLLQGPEHINSLQGILMRFRNHSVAFSCDVEKMFYNLSVPPEDRDFLRFLWLDEKSNVVECRMTVHTFGATSSPAVATYGLRRIAKDNQQKSAEAADFICSNFYVDDGIVSVPNDAAAIKLIHDARDLCSTYNIRLHKFVSNSANVLSSLPSTERKVQEEDISLLNGNATYRTLGMEWNVSTDSIKFSHDFKDKQTTKRVMLSTIAQLFDPLGLLASLTLKGKILLQEACRRNLTWDQDVCDDLRNKWTLWTENLALLPEVNIPRCTKPQGWEELKTTEVHYFSDASLSGYGACAYVRRTKCTVL